MRRAINPVLVVAIVAAMWPGAALSQSPDKSPTREKRTVAPAKVAETKSAAIARFELKDGDRVVFIGNTFFEREGRYGYIETMLTTRYPGRRITFRNLGWSGDTVWGESRGYFEPEKGYQNLIDLVAELKPTVIFLAYGNNEAFTGKEGLEPFIKQYNKLLDDLERFTKRIVILGCIIPEKHEKPLPDFSGYSSTTGLYNTAIEALARKQEHHFFPIQIPKLDRQERRATDNGLHLHDVGYFAVADTLCQNVYPEAEPWVVGLRLASGEEVIGGTKVQSFETT